MLKVYRTNRRKKPRHLCIVEIRSQGPAEGETQIIKQIEKQILMRANMRNKVTLIGNIASDPVVREMTGGFKMARFTLATNDQYKNKDGEMVKDTQWHNIVLKGGLADTAEKYIHKGTFVALEGKSVNRVYEDKGGQKRWMHEIQVHDLVFHNREKAA
jgi:single-strand DNA-binding protein